MPGPIHLLHIGKTGGNALQQALAPVAAERGFLCHPHSVRLADIPEGEAVIFILRDPVARFVSGFNSRLRMGRPLRNSIWTDGEAWAFSRFKIPNDLAEALSSEVDKPDAVRAMKEIRHVESTYADWLRSPDYIRARGPDIVWIGRTETLVDDFERLKERLELPASLALPDDPMAAHRTPEGFSQDLSDRGRANIVKWYEADRAFLL